MFEDLFINGMIIIAFLAIENQFFLKDNVVSPHSSLASKIIFGIMNGALGSVLVVYSLTIAPNVLFDFRHVPVILSALFGGMIPTVISSVFIGLFRLFYVGVSTSSLVGLIAIVISGGVFPLIVHRSKTLWKKWMNTALFSNGMIGISYLFLIENPVYFLKIISVWWIGNLLISYVLYKYTDYMITSNELLRRYKRESAKDFLTGLNNVRKFDEMMSQYSAESVANKKPFTLLFIDIDHFKKINDQYGHGEGDIVLQEMGKILQSECSNQGVVSRNGGEEFSVMVPDCSSKQALVIGEKIRKAVENYRFVLSDGRIATFPETTNQIFHLKEEADRALYEAKEQGRNQVVLYRNK
ncbi:GGDEF domain-containing protein [Fervidibacillus albus]|uniref:Diguanylate cyclase n=1 Tax=Fervidibacillus albus TaxID=2980026 RepID=A0A9E8LT62_9BACI|nr:diguanylate cyclase [Fervidibacillus albus]WAA09081.1 diguanylate cyclase [Fervidibacillus albus]